MERWTLNQSNLAFIGIFTKYRLDFPGQFQIRSQQYWRSNPTFRADHMLEASNSQGLGGKVKYS